MGLFDMFKKKSAPASDSIMVVAPVSGEVVQLCETDEPLFSSEALGKGVAIKPSDDTVYAPVAGTISVLMPHAVGVMTADGVEVLVHIGVETVNMKGEGFTSLVSQGDAVAAGQPLVRFDRQKIADAGYEDTVFVVITNTADLSAVAPVANGPASAGDLAVTVTK